MSQDLSNKLVSIIITNVIAGAHWTLEQWCSWTQLFYTYTIILNSHRELSYYVTFPRKMRINAYPPRRTHQRNYLVNQWVSWECTQEEAGAPETHSSVGLTQRSYIPGDPCTLCSQHHQRVNPSLVSAFLNLSILWLCKLPGSYSFISFLSLVSFLPLRRIILIWNLNDISYREIQ